MSKTIPLHAIAFLITFIGIHLCTQGGYGQPDLLFGNEEPLEITLTGNIRELLTDRGEDPQYHPIALFYGAGDTNVNSLSIKVKARGHFRKSKENCKMPPILLNYLLPFILK